jgi:5-methylcytosine-specific restriction enzyme subunit McrC
MKIPIQNIYYLLCYAWGSLEQGKSWLKTDSDEHPTTLWELLGNVLTKGITQLVKQGLLHEYQHETQTIAGIKGKLNLNETFKVLGQQQTQTICSFDVYSVDILPNQLLATTLQLFSKNNTQLSQKCRQDAYRLRQYLHDVNSIDLNEQVFAQAKQYAKRGIYPFLLSICELIHYNLLPNQEMGGYYFKDFVEDERQMSKLFEAFVRNFYKQEMPNARVYREHLRWQVQASSTDLAYLPRMETDISIAFSRRNILIDTKFYKETLTQRFDSQKVHAPHLYQLFAYMKNAPDVHEGILLYPVVEQSIHLQFIQEQQMIRVETLDLSCHWQDIHKQLMTLMGG